MMMMMMYSLHSTPSHSPCRHLLIMVCTADIYLDGYHVNGADCGLSGIALGVSTKNIPQ